MQGSTLGLKIAIIGFLIFLPGMASLLFLPQLIAMAIAITGATLVWSGFIMTLITFYTNPPTPPDVRDDEGRDSSP